MTQQLFNLLAMSGGIVALITAIVALVIAVPVTYFVVVNVQKSKYQGAAEKANKIISDAENEAKRITKEAEMEAKEDAHKLRSEVDAEIR